MKNRNCMLEEPLSGSCLMQISRFLSVLVVIWGRPRSSLPSPLKYLELWGYSKLNPEDVVQVCLKVYLVHQIYRVVDFFHAVNFPYYRGFGLDLWSSFLEHALFQSVLDLCPNVHPTIQMSETNTAYVQIGQEDCVLPVPPSACPRTRKSLVQIWTVCYSFSYSTLTQQISEEASIFIWHGRKKLPSHRSSL